MINELVNEIEWRVAWDKDRAAITIKERIKVGAATQQVDERGRETEKETQSNNLLI